MAAHRIIRFEGADGAVHVGAAPAGKVVPGLAVETLTGDLFSAAGMVPSGDKAVVAHLLAPTEPRHVGVHPHPPW